MKNTNLLVRVGGGFMDLDQYLKQQSRSECLKIQKVMEKDSLTYQEAVIYFLKKQKKSAKAITKFKKDNEQVSVPFTEVMQALKFREKRVWEERKSITSSSQLSRQGSVLELQRQVSNSSFKNMGSPVLRDKTDKINCGKYFGRTQSVIHNIPKLDL